MPTCSPGAAGQVGRRHASARGRGAPAVRTQWRSLPPPAVSPWGPPDWAIEDAAPAPLAPSLQYLVEQAAQRVLLVAGGEVCRLEGGVAEYVQQLGSGGGKKKAAVSRGGGGGKAGGKATAAPKGDAAAEAAAAQQAKQAKQMEQAARAARAARAQMGIRR